MCCRPPSSFHGAVRHQMMVMVILQVSASYPLQKGTTEDILHIFGKWPATSVVAAWCGVCVV